MARFRDAQIGAMVMGKRYLREVDFPGQEGKVKVAVRLLSDGEVDASREEAQRTIRDIAQSHRWVAAESVDIDPTQLDRLVKRQMIWRAFYDVDTMHDEKPVPFFASPADVAELDTVTLEDLYQCYLEHQEYVSPRRQLSEEEVEDLIDALGKGSAPEVLFSTLDRTTLVRFAISSAHRLSNSLTGKCSSGSDAEETTPNG